MRFLIIVSFTCLFCILYPRGANWIEPETALQVFIQVMQGKGVHST